MSGISNRDEFRKVDADALAKRVGGRCSNPGCRRFTTGPRNDPEKAVNIGIAAHITAAAPGGPRYDMSLSAGDRRSIQNGIWLCQNCAKLVDNDPGRYSLTMLRSWKTRAEESALLEIEQASNHQQTHATANLVLDRKNENIKGERHDYRLDAAIQNVGSGILRHYHIDLEMPTPVLIDTTARVEGRSDRRTSLFRKVWTGSSDDVFPGDWKTLLSIRYFMDQRLYQARGDLFSQLVRATLYVNERRFIVIEKEFEELQIY